MNINFKIIADNSKKKKECYITYILKHVLHNIQILAKILNPFASEILKIKHEPLNSFPNLIRYV